MCGIRVSGTQQKKGEEGFTLVEIMVVCVVIAILMAMGVFGLRWALHYGKLTTTHNSIRSVGTRWCANFGGNYPVIEDDDDPIPKVPVPLSDFNVVLTPLQVRSLVGPVVPARDAWNRPIEYRGDQPPPFTQNLLIASRNADGLLQSTYQYKSKLSMFDEVNDYVWVNCTWVQVACSQGC